jgi:hypothetical protein
MNDVHGRAPAREPFDRLIADHGQVTDQSRLRQRLRAISTVMPVDAQIAPHPTLSPRRPIAQARWDLAGRGSEMPRAVIEVMQPQLVHSLYPFLRVEGGVRGLGGVYNRVRKRLSSSLMRQSGLTRVAALYVRKSDTSDLRWSSPRVAVRGLQFYWNLL